MPAGYYLTLGGRLFWLTLKGEGDFYGRDKEDKAEEEAAL